MVRQSLSSCMGALCKIAPNKAVQNLIENLVEIYNSTDGSGPYYALSI